MDYRCKLSFALAIMYIHGACSQIHSPVYDVPANVQIADCSGSLSFYKPVIILTQFIILCGYTAS